MKKSKIPSTLNSVSTAVIFSLGLLFFKETQANILVAVEDPLIVNTTTTFSNGSIVENFDSFNLMNDQDGLRNAEGINFGGVATITGGFIRTPEWSGGAPVFNNGVYVSRGQFIIAKYDNAPTVIAFNSPQNYFGLWVSALSDGNIIRIYDSSPEERLLISFDASELTELLAGEAYKGLALNTYIGQNLYHDNEKFGFINFYATDGVTIGRIELDGDSFEADNFTVGMYSITAGRVARVGSFLAFAQAYGIQNMINAANSFDGVRSGTQTANSNAFLVGFNGLVGEALAITLLQASGEIHAFALSETRQGWQSSNSLIATAASINAHRNVWVDASGQSTRYKQDGFASAYDSSNTHLWVGTHLAEHKGTQVGVAVGVSRRKLNAVNSGSAESDSNAVALYAIGSKDQFDYSAIFSLNQSKIDTIRQTGLSTGTVSNTSVSKVKGAVLSATMGMKHELTKKVNGRVWVNGMVDHTKANDFNEQGSAVTALGVAKESFMSAQASVGYTVSGNVPVPDSRPGTWNLGFGVSKLLNEGRPHVWRDMSLHDGNWQVTAPKVGDVTQFVQAGVRLPVGANSEAWINLGASKRDGATSSSGNIGLNVKW